MTATHPHRRAGGNRGIDQPGLRRWFRAPCRFNDLPADTAGSTGLLVAANARWTGKRGDDTRGTDLGRLLRPGPVEVLAVSTHKKLVFAHYLTPVPGATRARGELIVGLLPGGVAKVSCTTIGILDSLERRNQ